MTELTECLPKSLNAEIVLNYVHYNEWLSIFVTQAEFLLNHMTESAECLTKCLNAEICVVQQMIIDFCKLSRILPNHMTESAEC